jgi:site-specific recombinase XerD
MLKTIFYIKTEKVKSDGTSPIYARLTFQSQSTTIATGKSISKERWDRTNNLRNVLKLEKEKVLKACLETFSLHVERTFNELSATDSNVDLGELKCRLAGRTEKVQNAVTVMDIFTRHNEHFKRKVSTGEKSPASHQKYERSKELVRQFLLQSYATNDIEVPKVQSAFIYNLESYLKYESVYKDKIGIGNNSVVKYFNNFKTVFNYGIKMELIEKNPFRLYDGKLKINDAVFLTAEELGRLENKAFGIQRLQKVKDIFLFCCYTGYAPVDAEKLTPANLIRDNDGGLWIQTDRQKTGVRSNVPVLPPARRIIERYSYAQSGLIPEISNQKMNAYLKEIADLCGIAKNLTWYVARHTFATTVTLGNGVRMENVSAMMGHTNIKQTQHYAKVLDQNVMLDMGRLFDMYTN